MNVLPDFESALLRKSVAPRGGKERNSHAALLGKRRLRLVVMVAPASYCVLDLAVTILDVAQDSRRHVFLDDKRHYLQTS